VFKLWREEKYSKQFCYENFLNFRSLSNARNIKDQLLDLVDKNEREIKIMNQDNVEIKEKD
jgi:hypothetical protein